MTPAAIAILAAVLAAPAAAQTTMTGDAVMPGPVGVGTEIPWATLHVQVSSTDAYGLIVSSPSGKVMLSVDAAGRSAVGGGISQSRLTVNGTPDSGDVALLLRAGGSTGSVEGVQASWAYDSTATYSHSLRTRSSTSALLGNGLDFYLWRDTSTPNVLGTERVLALESSIAAASGSFHIVPSTHTPDAEVEVSNGVTLGGGIVRYGSSGPPSSRALKSDISPLDAGALDRAYADVKALKHVRFRYSGDPSARRMRGLLFEEAPESVQGAHETINLNDRLLNLELALQAVNGRIRAVDLELKKRREGRGR